MQTINWLLQDLVRTYMLLFNGAIKQQDGGSLLVFMVEMSCFGPTANRTGSSKDWLICNVLSRLYLTVYYIILHFVQIVWNDFKFKHLFKKNFCVCCVLLLLVAIFSFFLSLSVMHMKDTWPFIHLKAIKTNDQDFLINITWNIHSPKCVRIRVEFWMV